ncbi:hypothetical protein ACH0BF_16345 [Pseudobacillus sp. 179-B 2D1 NHS]|uniref:hypothetical protein n=1 Tax=Pseudobacillus sp. 179-B 2D1 NHS TaxID=3374292 RepID=UPI00387A8043
MARIREWVTEARCIDCGGIYKIDPYYPLKKRCKPCSKAYRKRVKRIDRVQIISFLIFPLGILMYFLWKDNKPHLAKPALEAALVPIYILSGIFLFLFLLYIIISLA